MILLTRDDCPWCPPDLPGRIEERGGHVFKVIRHPDGTLYMNVAEGVFEKLPARVVALPTLLVNDAVICGLQPIEEFLGANPLTT